MTKEIKIKFAPGCFDSFEGSQEELDSLVSELTSMFQSKDFQNAEIVALSEDDLTEEEWDAIDAQHEKYMPLNRKLQ